MSLLVLCSCATVFLVIFSSLPVEVNFRLSSPPFFVFQINMVYGQRGGQLEEK